MSITLDLPSDLEGRLQKAARVQGKDVTALLLDTVRQHLQRNVLPESDTTLLMTINSPMPSEARRQRDALLDLQSQRELTDAEQEALARHVDAIELANAKRWESLAELAERRGLSLAEIARELEIPLP
ncbi:MAG TPA: hypothetical protein VKT77_22195 [Chthonomonadaceae bacterium]|nr:hypothetical protein [Chthonomonadaceae bacterium]